MRVLPLEHADHVIGPNIMSAAANHHSDSSV
jgi:hypothetical protein